MRPSTLRRKELFYVQSTVTSCWIGAKATGEREVSSKEYGLQEVERWGIWQIAVPETKGLSGKTRGLFVKGARSIEVLAFDNGRGGRCVRFSPDEPGIWRFELTNDDRRTCAVGSFRCTEARLGNHGPVGVSNTFQFAYNDSTPFYPFGTTCYGFLYVSLEDYQASLDGVCRVGFNKVRMSLMAKASAHGVSRVPFSPYPQPRTDATGRCVCARTASGSVVDLNSYNPEYFDEVDARIRSLLANNVQAELILFYPHDPLSSNLRAVDCRSYIEYVVARFSAYRNVWWSISNEYDLIKRWSVADWITVLNMVAENDPYGRLRSIHHSATRFDHSIPLLSHVSLQEYDFQNAERYRAAWRKPIIWDEVEYEGDIAARWGNLHATELVHRIWTAVCRGTYATHGETYDLPAGVNAWTIGGRLRGESGTRIRFLRSLIEHVGESARLEPDFGQEWPCLKSVGRVYLWYIGNQYPRYLTLKVPESFRCKVTLIKTYDMETICLGYYSGGAKIEIPRCAFKAMLAEVV